MQLFLFSLVHVPMFALRDIGWSPVFFHYFHVSAIIFPFLVWFCLARSLLTSTFAYKSPVNITSPFCFSLLIWVVSLENSSVICSSGPVLVCHSRPLYVEPSCLFAFLSIRCPGPGLLGQLLVGMCAWCHHGWVLLPLFPGCSCSFCKPTVAIYLLFFLFFRGGGGGGW